VFLVNKLVLECLWKPGSPSWASKHVPKNVFILYLRIVLLASSNNLPMIMLIQPQKLFTGQSRSYNNRIWKKKHNLMTCLMYLNY